MEGALTTAGNTGQSRGEGNALATSNDVTHLVGSELPDVPLRATTAAQPVSLREIVKTTETLKHRGNEGLPPRSLCALVSLWF